MPQVHPEHRRFGDAEIGGQGRGGSHALLVGVFGDPEHGEGRASLGDVGQGDHRPDERSPVLGDQLQVDGDEHVVHPRDHQGSVQGTEKQSSHRRGGIVDHHDSLGEQVPEVTGDGSDDRQGEPAGDDDRRDGDHQQLNGVGNPLFQPFFNDAQDVGRHKHGQNLALVTHFFDLEKAENVEIGNLPSIPAAAFP